jgi:hypothetical protein
MVLLKRASCLLSIALHAIASVSSIIFWRFVDRLDYWVWDVRLRIVDAMYGPEAETDA